MDRHAGSEEGAVSWTTQITNGRLVGYKDESTASPYSASSSRSINYAQGDSVQVGTEALTPLQGAGEFANVLSKVTGGYIFLYSDTSAATLHPSANIHNAEAKADIKAYGTIDIASDANNPTTGAPVPPIGTSTPSDLVATVDSVADSNKAPTITPHTWNGNGLALLADQSTVIPIKIGNKEYDLGHVGVAVWNDNGKWTVGAVQGPNNKISGLVGVFPGFYNGGWYKTVPTFLDVESYLAGSNVNNRPGVKNTGSVPGNGIYDKIMVIPVDNPDSKDADAKMANFPSRGFWFAGLNAVGGYLYSNDCLDAAADALTTYGAPVLTPWPDEPPNDFFANLPGTVYTLSTDPAWKALGVYTHT